ncbi:MAG TPA: hypothetical protein GYA08_02885 [Chloroflexi bacterium]|nr:hypothetical protein [Chloroflexota bacterium]
MSLNFSHIPYIQLVDWVEGRLPDEQQAALATHIAGCARCRDEAARISRMITVMREDASVDAPPALIARAVKLFRSRTAEPAPSLLQRLVAVLTFESTPLTPAFGLRSAESSARQMIFAAGDYDIDLRMTLAAGGWRVAGQVFGPNLGSGAATFLIDSDTITVPLHDDATFTFPPLPPGQGALTLRSGNLELVVEELSIGAGG